MKPRVLRRNALIEATIFLAMARIAVRLLSAERLIAWMSRSPRRVDRFAPHHIINAVCRAVDEVGSKPWMQAVCLPRAVAAQAMLRRRGIASRLCLGAARNSGDLVAHAWLELDQATIIGGGPEKWRFTRLVSFG